LKEESKKWWILINDDVSDEPYTKKELRNLEEFGPDTKVCLLGSDEWQQADEMDELKPLFGSPDSQQSSEKISTNKSPGDSEKAERLNDGGNDKSSDSKDSSLQDSGNLIFGLTVFGILALAFLGNWVLQGQTNGGLTSGIFGSSLDAKVRNLMEAESYQAARIAAATGRTFEGSYQEQERKARNADLTAKEERYLRITNEFFKGFSKGYTLEEYGLTNPQTINDIQPIKDRIDVYIDRLAINDSGNEPIGKIINEMFNKAFGRDFSKAYPVQKKAIYGLLNQELEKDDSSAFSDGIF
jgi:hypothetical protein